MNKEAFQKLFEAALEPENARYWIVDGRNVFKR
jgi:hypothetical protein